MSVGSILSVARTALNAQQLVIQTTGHNIANAQTEGYSRQRVELGPNFPQQFPYGAVGTGVKVNDVSRARDTLLDVSVREETGGEAATGLRKDLLSSMEEVLGEPSDTGLASTMDAYWSSWSDLATTPSSRAARSVVLQRGRAAADTLNQFDARLTDLRSQTTLRLDNAVIDINGLADQIAQLNGQIVSTEVGGGHEASDLRDQRDLAIDKLAAYGNVRALERPDGSVQVLFGTNTLVDGIAAKALTRTTDALGKVAIAFADTPQKALQPSGGSTQAMTDFLNDDLQGMQDQLDAFANTLAATVNAVQAQGQDATGQPPPPFFVDKTSKTFDGSGTPFDAVLKPGTVTARTISVNETLVTSPALVATSSSKDRPTDNDVALALAALRTGGSTTLAGVTTEIRFTLPDRSTNPLTLAAPSPPTSFGDFYRSAVSALGVQVNDAESAAQVRATLADQARTRRESVSGVNVDEELTTLMSAQQAYAAAAKIVNAADEMMKTLLDLVR